jgi:hypothetical protein
MTVTGTDLRWFLSSSGSSEGGARSATEPPNAVDNNVFPDINDVDRLAGGSVKRKVFLHNQNGVDAYLPHSIWIVRPPLNCTSWIGLGFDDADDDDPTAGTLTDLTATGKIALISDGPDTRSVDLHGYSSSGDPLKETVVLTGATEVLSVGDFSSHLAIHTTISASRIITIKQGAGGTTRGTIPVGGVNCFRWLTATSKALGLKLIALPPGLAEGIWERRDHAPGATAGDANRFGIKAEKL